MQGDADAVPLATEPRVRDEVAARHENLVALADWRRRVADLYADVRALAPETAWARWRAVRDTLFREHPQTPLEPERRKAFGGIDYFAYDPALRFTVALATPAARETLIVEAGGDGRMRLVPYALTKGLAPVLGGELTLYWIEAYGGGTFLPFRDATSGKSTYAGGRYLLDTIKSADLGAAADGRLVLDFNFAYYPSCAYSDAWICPLAPRENVLAEPIRAGERDLPTN